MIDYCRRNYPWNTPVYMEVNFGKIVLVSDYDTYEKCIREIFKTDMDIAAELTKKQCPQISVMCDGIGLVLADNAVEAVRKVISILEKAKKMYCV